MGSHRNTLFPQRNTVFPVTFSPVTVDYIVRLVLRLVSAEFFEDDVKSSRLRLKVVGRNPEIVRTKIHRQNIVSSRLMLGRQTGRDDANPGRTAASRKPSKSS